MPQFHATKRAFILLFTLLLLLPTTYLVMQAQSLNLLQQKIQLSSEFEEAL